MQKPSNDFLIISNSIPKSGSTFLFKIQEELLRSLYPDKQPTREFLAEIGIDSINEFIHREDAFSALIDANFSNGPYLVKAHTPIRGIPKKLLEYRIDVKMSFILRNPVDILFSAMDNYKNSDGKEFPQFREVSSGINTIKEKYLDYWQSVCKFNKNKPRSESIQVLKYEDLFSYPEISALQSLGVAINQYVAFSPACAVVSLDKASAAAAHRKQQAKLVRNNRDISDKEFESVVFELKHVLHSFGYTDPFR
jgi:hypothetical protein